MSKISMNQTTAAHNLLVAIRRRIKNGDVAPYRGYTTAAFDAGYTVNSEDAGRAMGQVTSRIDLAAFYAGLPMLALHWVRMPDGGINPGSFINSFPQHLDGIVQVATQHQWTVEDVDAVRRKLLSLDQDEGARSLWKYVQRREAEKPGFFKYNLHRAAHVQLCW